MARRKDSLQRLIDPLKCETHSHNTPLASLEELLQKKGRPWYYPYYFLFVGIISSVVKQISFQNHKWKHWNPTRRWVAWGSSGKHASLLSPACQEGPHYHRASNIYLPQIPIKITLSRAAEMCTLVTAEDLMHILSLIEDHQGFGKY